MHRASGRLRPTSRRTQPHPVRSRPISSSADRAHVRAGKSPMGRRRLSASLVRRERPSPDHREHRGMDAFDAGERGDEAERTGERRLEIEGTGSMTLHPETVPDAGRPTSGFRSEMDPNGSGATAARRPWYGSPCRMTRRPPEPEGRLRSGTSGAFGVAIPGGASLRRRSRRTVAADRGQGHTDPMTAEDLRGLPPGAGLVYVSGTGREEERHPARVVAHGPGYTSVVVYFTTRPQALVRWSMTTNLPIGAEEHVGIVRLEP